MAVYHSLITDKSMIYISVGSNIGNRLANLRKAVGLLKIDILQHTYESIIIETKAILKDNADPKWDLPYLNMIIAGKTSLSPESLLCALKHIEQVLGRDQTESKWGPRVIDLDIIIYNVI